MASIPRFDPIGDMVSLRSAMDRLFGQFSRSMQLPTRIEASDNGTRA